MNFVGNPDFREGLSSSLKAGLIDLSPSPSAVIVCLADMPKIQPRHINRLLDQYNPAKGYDICIPTNNGKRGNPVLIGRRLFKDVFETSGDIGAKMLLQQYPDNILEVEMGTDDIHLDLDTQDEYENFTTSGI